MSNSMTMLLFFSSHKSGRASARGAMGHGIDPSCGGPN